MCTAKSLEKSEQILSALEVENGMFLHRVSISPTGGYVKVSSDVKLNNLTAMPGYDSLVIVISDPVTTIKFTV